MQRGAQLDAPTYNLTFAQFDNRRDDPDLRLGPGPGAHQFGKHPVVLRATIGIARTVFGDRADEHTARAEDSSGYPDCRPEYYRVFAELVRAGTRPETQIGIVTPVIELRKSEIVRRGIELGAPLHLTWSCYQFEDAACGVCDSCRLRLRAFAEAGQPDPIPYRAPVA